jgi:hypothetical protein
MDVFASYIDHSELSSGDEEEDIVEEAATTHGGESEHKAASSADLELSVSVNLAPSVTPILGLGAFAPAESKEVMFNPRADTLYAPVQGPAGLPPGMKRDTINNTPTGHVEHTNINAFLFDQQYHTFHCYGFAADPTVGAPPRAMVGDAERLQAKAAHSVFDPRPSARQTRKEMKNKRQESGDPSSDSYLGPWAPPKEEEEQQQQPRQLTPEEVAAYEAWKPISRKKKRQMERAAMLAEMGEGDEEPEEQEKKKKKKKKEKKNIETIFTEEDNAKINQPPLAVGPTRPPPQQSTDGDGDGGDD